MTMDCGTCKGPGVTNEDKPRAGEDLAGKVDRLFRLASVGRKPLTHYEVSTAIAANGGPTISHTYLWMLRHGKRDNPTKQHIEALAAYFGVPVNYFFDDEASEAVSQQLDVLMALRAPDVRSLALRSVGLGPDSLRMLRSLADHLQALQAEASESRGTAASPPPPRPLGGRGGAHADI